MDMYCCILQKPLALVLVLVLGLLVRRARAAPEPLEEDAVGANPFSIDDPTAEQIAPQELSSPEEQPVPEGDRSLPSAG